MNNIAPIKLEAFHIISEPGDSIRYDYFILLNNDNIHFIANEQI